MAKQKTFKAILKQYGLDDSQLTVSNLRKKFTELGFEIIEFTGDEEKDETAFQLIDKLKLHKQYYTENGFIYNPLNSTSKILFIKRGLTQENEKSILLHELYHFSQNDTYYLNAEANYKIAIEKDANNFVNYIINRRRKTIKAAVLTTCAIAIVVVLGINLGLYLQINNNEQQTLPNQKTNTEIVVVTRTGAKYHLPDCRYVENKTDTEEMTVEEALSKGLGPCQVCKPGIE